MASFENHPLHPGEGVPLFISAGVLKEPGQLAPFMEIEDPLAVPLLFLGGFTLTEWGGNAKPGQVDFTYRPETGEAGNCRGLPNPGAAGIRALKEPIKECNERGIKTVIQITNLSHEEAVDVIPKLAETAAEVEPSAIEVNLSCPNGKKADGTFHAPLSSNADASGEVMEKTRHVVGPDVVIGAKDSPHVLSLHDAINFREIEQLARAIAQFIDFVGGINTIGNQDFPELTAGNGKGGMSGPIVAPIARAHAALWGRIAPEIPYLSTGGVDSVNAETEITERLAMPNVIRVGGAQEFYRAGQPHQLAARWAIAAA